MAGHTQPDRIADGIADDASAGRQYNIKNMPEEARATVRRYALMRGETHADWITRAVYRQAAIEAGDEIIPPAAATAATPPAPARPIDFAGLAELVHELTASFQAAGLAVPKSLPRGVHRMLRQALGIAAGKTGTVGGVAATIRTAIEAERPDDGRYNHDRGVTDD